MLVIAQQHDRSDTLVPDEVFAAGRLTLPAIGLVCWLAHQPRQWRTRAAALARFGLTTLELSTLVDELRRAGLLEPEAAGS